MVKKMIGADAKSAKVKVRLIRNIDSASIVIISLNWSLVANI